MGYILYIYIYKYGISCDTLGFTIHLMGIYDGHTTNHVMPNGMYEHIIVTEKYWVTYLR